MGRLHDLLGRINTWYSNEPLLLQFLTSSTNQKSYEDVKQSRSSNKGGIFLLSLRLQNPAETQGQLYLLPRRDLREYICSVALTLEGEKEEGQARDEHRQQEALIRRPPHLVPHQRQAGRDGRDSGQLSCGFDVEALLPLEDSDGQHRRGAPEVGHVVLPQPALQGGQPMEDLQWEGSRMKGGKQPGSLRARKERGFLSSKRAYNNASTVGSGIAKSSARISHLRNGDSDAQCCSNGNFSIWTAFKVRRCWIGLLNNEGGTFNNRPLKAPAYS
jgi:hypothetical protein